MFGRKVTEKRSLEDMFTKDDSVFYENLEEDDEFFDDELEYAKNEITPDEILDEIKRSKGDPIKPMDCFGMEEAKTEKWLSKCVKFWFCCMSFMWFLFGALTFAPVIFISSKVNVIFKEKVKSFVFATIIYCVISAIILLLIFA